MQDFIDKVVETIRQIPQEHLEEVRSGRAVLNLRICGTDVEPEVVSIRQCLDRTVKRLQLVVDELRELKYQLEVNECSFARNASSVGSHHDATETARSTRKSYGDV